jgi:dTDP-4-amino-4,6-dideoxygalactose transaminase
MISVFGSKVGKEEIDQVADSIHRQWIGIGPKVKGFEEAFSKRLGLPNFIMTDSGSNGLYMACRLLDLPAGSEIIVPSYTWVACAQAVLMAGHKPVLCDVDKDTMNITAETISPRLGENVRAVMIVHYAGLAVEMDEIQALGLPVIEDAAHAVDSTYRGQSCGGIGDVGVFSFDAVKNLAVGEGGGLTARTTSMGEHARTLRYCGIGKSGFEACTDGKSRWWEYNINEAFIKMIPSDVSAAIGIAQLEKLNTLQTYRKRIWEYYFETFTEMGEVILPAEARQGDRHSYFTYCIKVPKRDELARYLLDNGIYTTLRYHPLHLNPFYGQTDCRLPNSEKLNESALNIPLHPNMSEEDARKVASCIKDFYTRNSAKK